MKIFAVHGLGHQEHQPQTWQKQWDDAFEEAFSREGIKPTVEYAVYDDLFGKTPMTVGGTVTGFGALLWDEVKYGVVDAVSGLWPFKRRGFGERVDETVKWKVGMVTQFAEDTELRARLRAHLRKQIDAFQPDVVFAHSLGTLLTYNLFLNDPAAIQKRYYVTAGCQIGRAALRTLFGGRLETVAAEMWYNLHNPHDDVLVVPLAIYTDNFRQIDASFDIEGIADHDGHEYIRQPNAISKVWREIAQPPAVRRSFAAGVTVRSNTRIRAEDTVEADAALSISEEKHEGRRALLIGINEYPNPDDRLEGCVNDVFRMSSALQHIGFEPEEIRIVLNERATADGIRRRFAWLMEDPRPGDVRVLFYSGHGTQIPDYSADETVDHKDESLVAHDFDWNNPATHLKDDDFNQLYAQLPYDTTFAGFFDCCHSGGIARMGGARIRGLNPPDDIRHRMLRWNRRERIWEPREFAEKRKERGLKSYLSSWNKTAVEKFTGEDGATSRKFRSINLSQMDGAFYSRQKELFGHKGPYLPMIFEACRESQFAYEYRDGVTSYGAYTYFLTQALFRATDKKERLTFQSLHEKACELVRGYYGDQQTPQIVGPKVLCQLSVPVHPEALGKTAPAAPGTKARKRAVTKPATRRQPTARRA